MTQQYLDHLIWSGTKAVSYFPPFNIVFTLRPLFYHLLIDHRLTNGAAELTDRQREHEHRAYSQYSFSFERSQSRFAAGKFGKSTESDLEGNKKKEGFSFSLASLFLWAQEHRAEHMNCTSHTPTHTTTHPSAFLLLRPLLLHPTLLVFLSSHPSWSPSSHSLSPVSPPSLSLLQPSQCASS